MGTITLNDGTEIFYKDWSKRDTQTIVFHHGWPLSSDDWDAQMLFFLNNGYRVVAHDRRGHGRSTQTDTGNEMDTYAADVIALAKAVLVMHGDDDKVAPIADSAMVSSRLLKHATLKVYKGFPHGMATTHADTINKDLLNFIKSKTKAAAGSPEPAASS